MSESFELRLQKGEPQITFPNRCISCGKPKETTDSLKVERNVRFGTTTRQLAFTLPVPLCGSCQHADKRVTLLTLGAFGLGGLAAGIAACFPFFLLSARLESFLGTGSDNQTRAFAFVLAAFLALIFGIAAGFVVEFIVKLIATPFLNIALWHYPASVVQILSDVATTAGLTAQISRDGDTVWLNFSNDDIASDFARLNKSEISV